MGFLKKLSSFFAAPARSSNDNSYWITVQCNRCGEQIRARVDLLNDLSPEYGESGEMTYLCRKVLMGEKLCFQQIEVTLTFDANRKVLDRQITGGKFVDVEPASTD
jgi:hypothetical protein